MDNLKGRITKALGKIVKQSGRTDDERGDNGMHLCIVINR